MSKEKETKILQNVKREILRNHQQEFCFRDLPVEMSLNKIGNSLLRNDHWID